MLAFVTSRKLHDAPGSEEVSVMLRAPGWLGLAIALAALAGMRMGEVRALECRDVDSRVNAFWCPRALSEDVFITPKSGHEREVPLALALETRLREAVKDKLPRARIVLDDAGQTPRRQQVLHAFKRFLKDCVNAAFTHRHYFVSELLRNGASAEAARVLAGHSSLENTQRYSHATDADLRAAIDRLGR